MAEADHIISLQVTLPVKESLKTVSQRNIGINVNQQIIIRKILVTQYFDFTLKNAVIQWFIDVDHIP